MGKNNRIFYFIAVSVIILSADYLGILNFLKAPADRMIIPVKREIFTTSNKLKDLAFVTANYSSILNFYEEKKLFVKENEELQSRIKELQTENLKMRTQLEAPFPSSFKFVPSQVISVGQFMQIDQGTNEGIRKGQIVVDGITLVGVVENVSSARSNIRLVTDPDFQISAVTSRDTRGIVAGGGEQNIALTKILQKDPLFLDDQVVTSGDEFTPPNLLIGKIAHITQEEAATYKQAKVTGLIDFTKEKIVFVITSL